MNKHSFSFFQHRPEHRRTDFPQIIFLWLPFGRKNYCVKLLEGWRGINSSVWECSWTDNCGSMPQARAYVGVSDWLVFTFAGNLGKDPGRGWGRVRIVMAFTPQLASVLQLQNSFAKCYKMIFLFLLLFHNQFWETVNAKVVGRLSARSFFIQRGPITRGGGGGVGWIYMSAPHPKSHQLQL